MWSIQNDGIKNEDFQYVNNTKGSTGTIKPTTVKNGGVGGGSGGDNTGQSGTGTGGTGNGKVTTSARRRRRQATSNYLDVLYFSYHYESVIIAK